MAYSWSVGSASPSQFVVLSDGSVAFAALNGGTTTVYRVANHTTVSTVATLTNVFDSSSGQVSLGVDSSDNLYLVGSPYNLASSSQVTAVALVNTGGPTGSWAATAAQAWTSYNQNDTWYILDSVCWANTGGGTNGKGHLILSPYSTANSSGDVVVAVDAGALLAGSGFTVTSRQQGAVEAVVSSATASLGATSGVAVEFNSSSGNGPSYFYSWSVNSSGTLTLTNIGTATISWAGWTTVLYVGGGQWAGVYTASNTTVGAVGFTTSTIGTPAASPTVALGGYASSTPLTPAAASPQPNTVWVWVQGPSGASASANAYRIEATVGNNTVTWASAPVEDSTDAVPSADTINWVVVAAGQAITVDWLASAGSAGLFGSSTAFATAPNAPTLDSPANSSYQDVSSGETFTATYNSTDSANQNAYAARIKTSGATAYSYYNASTNALQSTVVWNSVSTAPGANWSWTIPASAISDGNTYNWSAASQEAGANLQGPFAADFTFNAQGGPALTIVSPGGTETTATPLLSYVATPASGSSITAGQWLVYPLATTQATGFNVNIASATIPAGAVSNVTWTGNPGTVTLQSGVTLAQGTWVAYAAVQETGGQWSSTVNQTFTVAYDTPAQPTVTAAPSTDPATGCPVIAVTVQGHDNLLSTADASFEGSLGTWVAGANTEIALTSAEALDGSDSLLLQATAAGNLSASTAMYQIPVGAQLTAIANFRATSTVRDVTVSVDWYQSNGSASAVKPTSTSTPGTDATTAWTQASVTDTAPSDATQAAITVTVASAAAPLATPAAPTVTPTGTTGSTAYYYKVVGHNAYGTVTSAEGSTTTGNATLSSTNYNALAWTAETGITSWDVWRGTTSGGENTLVASDVTGTTYNDTGGGTAGTMPTANTTGESHYVDEVDIAPGQVSQWTRGGLVGLTNTVITRAPTTTTTSPDAVPALASPGWMVGGEQPAGPASTSGPFAVRNASPANPLTIPSPGQTAMVYDYEAAPGVAYTYTATVNSGTGTSMVTSPPASSASATLTTTRWWVLDPTSPAGACSPQPVQWNPVQIEQATARIVLGQPVTNVVSAGGMNQDFNGTFELFDAATYTAFQALLTNGKIVWISSSFDLSDCGWYRIGPVSGGLSMGTGVKQKDAQLMPSTSAGPHRTVTITAVAAPRPSV